MPNQKQLAIIMSKSNIENTQKAMLDPNTWISPSDTQYLVRWFFVPKENVTIEQELLKKFAKDYQLSIEVWVIENKLKQKLMMLSVPQISSHELLQNFINHAPQLFIPVPLKSDFKLIKINCFNAYGMYELQTQSLECTICLDQKTANIRKCCGKSICNACNLSSKCPFCGREELDGGWLDDQSIKLFHQWLTQILKDIYEP